MQIATLVMVFIALTLAAIAYLREPSRLARLTSLYFRIYNLT